ncbi:MAG: hypothetical protein KA022_00010 [Candidatus Omnitrophica bacterium]|nr:hypothetical protein [Candidatus Omnitrophota bacterium]
MNKAKDKPARLKFYILTYSLAFSILIFSGNCFAQQSDDLECELDVAAATIPTPKIFKPNLDLSGRGSHYENTWPQSLAAKETLEAWQRDIGFNGFYRLQYNLWDISQFSKDKAAKDKALAHYESIIKSVSDAGGVVILNIFGTPAGVGKILDKKSAPVNLPAFKELIKGTMQDLSCAKKYNIWYEVWNAPDLENFFLGRQQEYFNLYRLVSESARELEAQYKVRIPVGAPSASSWFRHLESNTIFTPEASLIYKLIKFCYQNHLNLNFISWHGFSTDPRAEKENTIYNKNAVGLIRDWLSYFNFDRNTPLIVDEWNYDRDANLLPERKEKSYITASYIPARIKNMYEAGLDNQVYFCLEDFQDNKERVTRNVGVFYFDARHSQYKGRPKAVYNAFRMLKELGPDMFSFKLKDEFAGILATRSKDKLILLVYNYLDPELVRNLLAANISGFNPVERKFLLSIIRSDQLTRIMAQHANVNLLPTTSKVKSLLKNAQELNDKAERLKSAKRSIKINLKNVNGDYSYSRFTVDASCGLDCDFKPSLEKEISTQGSYQDELILGPYSVNLIILTKKPEPPKVEPAQTEPLKASEPPKADTAKDANAAGK